MHARCLAGALAVGFLLSASSCATTEVPASDASQVPSSPKPTSTAAAPESVLHAILATTVLGVGSQRVAFILTRPDSLVPVPEATVTSVYLDGQNGASETKQAAFYLWPYGVRGSYSTKFFLNQPGQWRLDVSVTSDDGTNRQTQVFLDVQERVEVAGVGSVPPLIRNKTVWDVESLAELSSAAAPDPDLYAMTITTAMTTGNPTMIVFSTPAFCVSPTCGPQVEVLTDLQDTYGDQANFIHVELYDNPADIQGDLSAARYSPLVDAWGLSSVPGWTNESWTFVLGRDGRIASRFEAFAPREELEQTLLALLN